MVASNRKTNHEKVLWRVYSLFNPSPNATVLSKGDPDCALQPERSDLPVPPVDIGACEGKDLTGQLAKQEATYANKASGLRHLVAMMGEREQQAKEPVDSIEKEWDQG